MAHSLKTVPAAGFEPAAPSVSARCSHQLSYTGIGQRRRQESNLLRSRVAADRLAVRPRRRVEQSQRWDSNPLRPRYEGGARPVEHRWHSGWPVGVEPTQPRFTAGSRTRFGFGHSASTWTRTRNPGFAVPRDARFTTEAISTPARSRTWTCSLGPSRDGSVSPPRYAVPGVGVEPTPAGSEPAVLPLDDPGIESSP